MRNNWIKDAVVSIRRDSRRFPEWSLKQRPVRKLYEGDVSASETVLAKSDKRR